MKNSKDDYVLVKSKRPDLVLAESRIEAVKSLSIILVREINILKKIIESRRSIDQEGNVGLNNALHAYESGLIEDALLRSAGNQRKAAALLAIKVTTLNEKIKRLGIQPNRYERSFET